MNNCKNNINFLRPAGTTSSQHTGTNNDYLELLCPAGSPVALHAAVRGGADAVYLGGAEFNARRGAGNFSEAELREAVKYAHLRGVRVYLTFNIAVFESEIRRALTFAHSAAAAGVDAFIVQDVGVCSMLASSVLPKYPQVRLHASTQMNIHSADGLLFAARLGAARVTLTRELSIVEISTLCALGRKLGVEVEVFGHGALCVCYSGQCLMSSMIGGRSANRGTCAQACRLEYELCRGEAFCTTRATAYDGSKMAETGMTGSSLSHHGSAHHGSEYRGLAHHGLTHHGSEHHATNYVNKKQYLLSPKDLCSIDVLLQLAAVGVASLKIEGRMKSPEYVYSVAKIYREAIDCIVAESKNDAIRDKNWKCDKLSGILSQQVQPCDAAIGNSSQQVHSCDTETENLSQQVQPCDAAIENSSQQVKPTNSASNDSAKKQLAQVFSRGFTTAYLTGERDNSIMGYQRPNNRGVRIGRVAGVSKTHLSIDTAEKITPGDIIEIWTSKGRAALRVDKNFNCNACDKGKSNQKSSKHKRKHQSKSVAHILEAKLDMTKAELRGVRKGDRVFRVRSVEDEFIDNELEPRIAVEGEILLRIGQPLALCIWTKQRPEQHVEVQSNNVEQARTRAVSEADIKEHICRTGQTPFEFSSLKVELDDNVGIGFSTLHHLRAEALDKLERKLYERW